MSKQLVLKSKQEAAAVAKAMSTGQMPDGKGGFREMTDDEKRMGHAALKNYAAERQQVLEHVEQQRDPVTGKLPDKPRMKVIDRTVNAEGEVEINGPMSDVLRRTGGAMQVGATMATGAPGEIAGGTAGLATLLLTRDNDAATAVTEAVTDALTLDPVTETGEDMLKGLMKKLVVIEESADWLATKGSMGNPIAATMIKTGLLGGIEMLGVKGAGRARVPKKMEELVNAAEKLGIELDVNNMQSSIIEAARKMSPAERAANAGFLQQAMRDAKKAASEAVDAEFEKARNGRAFVQVSEVHQLAKEMTKELIEEGADFRTKGMEDIVNQLNDMADFGDPNKRPGRVPDGTGGTNSRIVDAKGEPLTPTQMLTQRVGDIELIRRRLVQLGRSEKGNVRRAANRMKHMMDDWMDHQLASSLIDGDPAVIKAWKDARIQHSDYMKNFKDDRMIKNLIEMEATPEQVRAWVTGMMAVGAKANAGSTIKRIRDVLGDNHPAIEGIRQDFLYEVAAPLLKESPNFKQFIDNYDKFIKNNPTVVKQMGLHEGDLRQLRDFAVTAEKLGTNQPLMQAGFIPRALATYFFGHDIARKGLKVNFARRFASVLFGIDRVTARKILADATNVAYGKPILPRNSVGAAAFISANYLSMADEVIEEVEEKEKEREAERQRRHSQNPTI